MTETLPQFTPYTKIETENWFRRGMGCGLPSSWEDHYAPGTDYLDSGYAPTGGYVKDFTMVHDGRAWHMFHIDGRPGENCNFDGNEIAFGHASTGDLRHWIRHACPLSVGNHAEWDSRHVFAPFVRRDPKALRWLMYYMGTSQLDPHHGHIGRATSPDLLFWTKDGNDTLYHPGVWSNQSCRDPHVFQDDGGYAMLATTNTADGSGALALARSSDLLHWEDQEPFRIFKEEGWTPESSGAAPCRNGWLLWVSACSEEGTIPLYLAHAATLEGLRHAPLAAVGGEGPRAIAMEVLHRCHDQWLVAYFARVPGLSFRLFFGVLDLRDMTRPNLTAINRSSQLVAYRSQADSPQDPL